MFSQMSQPVEFKIKKFKQFNFVYINIERFKKNMRKTL